MILVDWGSDYRLGLADKCLLCTIIHAMHIHNIENLSCKNISLEWSVFHAQHIGSVLLDAGGLGCK